MGTSAVSYLRGYEFSITGTINEVDVKLEYSVFFWMICSCKICGRKIFIISPDDKHTNSIFISGNTAQIYQINR